MSAPTTVPGLRLRRVLGREDWCPPQPFGPDGWKMMHRNGTSSVIVSAAPFDDAWYVHASMSHRDRLPSYDELKLLHQAAFGDGWAYQVFAPPADHVNIHAYALHLWGRADGAPVLPDFTCGMGTI